MTTPPTGLIQTEIPDKPGKYDTYMWGGQINPFAACPRYGGCSDYAAAASAPPPVTARASPSQTAQPPLDLLAQKKLNDLLSQKDPSLVSMEKTFETISDSDAKSMTAEMKTGLQNKANTLIDKYFDEIGKPSGTDFSDLKQRFESSTNMSLLIKDMDRLGIQSQDLSYSRLNTYAGAFAQTTLQTSLDYRTALVAKLRADAAQGGTAFEKDKQDLRDLTDRMIKLYPDRKQEFETYQTQTLQSLTGPAPSPAVGP